MADKGIMAQMAQMAAPVTGLGRVGGMAQRGSTPVSPSPGKKFAAMENAMLKQMRPNPKKLSGAGKMTRQFKKAQGENFGQG